eukprot:2222246-Heterocapsa_arctica.AAC.1
MRASTWGSPPAEAGGLRGSSRLAGWPGAPGGVAVPPERGALRDERLARRHRSSSLTQPPARTSS